MAKFYSFSDIQLRKEKQFGKMTDMKNSQFCCEICAALWYKLFNLFLDYFLISCS